MIKKKIYGKMVFCEVEKLPIVSRIDPSFPDRFGLKLEMYFLQVKQTQKKKKKKIVSIPYGGVK